MAVGVNEVGVCSSQAPCTGDLGNWDGKSEEGMGKGLGCRSSQAIAKVSFVSKKGALWSKWSAEKERLMVELTIEGGRDESEGGV